MEPIQFYALTRDGVLPYGIAAGIVCLAFTSNLASATPAADIKAQVQSNYGKLALSFEANQGQADARVKFLARGQGYVLFLTPSEAVLSLRKSQAQARAPYSAKFSPSDPPNPKFSPSSKMIGAVLHMQFIGANPAPRIGGKDALSGRVNYLVGQDSSRWIMGMPTYAKVAYEDVYPGVDLVYYGNQGQLEYDFVVAPRADPGQVKLAFRGADKIEVNPAGELILNTANGELRMHKPVIYQEFDGVRKPINGGYALKDDRTVGFQVAAYDATHPLIIDPVLIYSTYLSGSDLDGGLDIAVDKKGQAYVAGQTVSTDFPIKNAPQPTFGGGFGDFGDAFVAQLTADGKALRYATYLGGNRFDQARGIAVDKRGQAYVTGPTESSNFPTVNALQPTLDGVQNAFVAQLTADGTMLRYSTYLGGGGSDFGSDIAVDERGQAYVVGFTSSNDFPTVRAMQPDLGGGSDAFVAKFTADGDTLRYATYLGGSNSDGGSGIAVDQRGRAYVTGDTQSTDFPTENALQPTFGGGVNDAFVVQFTTDGSSLLYATYLGGNNSDGGSGIAVDQRGRAYVTGTTSSDDFPIQNALQSVLGGSSDAFVAQFTVDGSSLLYATYLGGSNRDGGSGIAVDQRGQAYVTGTTSSDDFPIQDALQSVLRGPSDAFVAQFTANGAALRYATYLGGSGGEFGSGIAVDKQGQVYVTGETSSADFPTENALQPTSVGGSPFDAFVTKIGSNAQP